MNYNEFRKLVQKWPLIFSQDVIMNRADKQIIRNQLKRWSQRQLLIKLRRGIFILNADDRKVNPSRTYIANQLYPPSYVSLEYALNYYGFIPELVSDLTSITTRKTAHFKNDAGTFIYQHIKPKAFRGFRVFKDEAGFSFLIADPEKALVDFIYLNLEKFHKDDMEVFDKSYRFQNLEKVKSKKIIEYADLFGNDKLKKVCRLFCKFVKEKREER